MVNEHKSPKDYADAGQIARLRNSPARYERELGRKPAPYPPVKGLAAMLQAMGARAKARREELGLTVNEVAIKMGRTYQCIYGMERSGIESLRVVLEWAEALGMSPQELAFGGKTQSAQTAALTLDIRSQLLMSAADLIDGRRGRRKELVRLIREELGQ